MKKSFVLAALTLIWAACGVEDNPFGSDPDHGWQGGGSLPRVTATGTFSGGLGNHVVADVDPETEGIQDAILVQFDQAMSPGSFSAGDFDIEATWPEQGTVGVEDVEYIEELKMARVWATFDEESAWILTMSAGSVTDLGGNPVDANHNGLEDGAPWDDLRATFHHGSAPEADLASPVIDGHYPTGGGLTDPLPDIAVIFALGPMDTTTLNLESFTLVVTEGQAPVAVELVSVTETQIVMRPRSELEPGVRYTVTLSPAVADTSGNLLDSNGDGYLWPDEEDFTWDIQMADDSTTHSTPPTVAGVAGGNPDYLTIDFQQSLTGLPVVMDDATFTAANIQVLDAGGMVPLRFEPLVGLHQVRCYFQRPVSGPMQLWVSAMVRDEWGNGLDGNGDGLGGTPGEDDWTATL